MRIPNLRRTFLAMAFLLAMAGSVFPQQPEALQTVREDSGQKALSYTFVSPNTRENLTLEEAIRLLNSAEERKLVNAIRGLSRCLGLKPVVMRTIGSWADGAEHSTLFRIRTDGATLRYEDARLGKVERQKTVLNFRQDASGRGRMYILRTRRARLNLAAVSKKLDETGVAFRTLVPQAHRSIIIYVVDLNNELQKQILSAARQLSASLSVIKGTGEFIGDDSDRDKAQLVFGEIIKGFEDAHPSVGRKCSRVKGALMN